MSEITDLIRDLRKFQADEPGFPKIFDRAADALERLSERCDAGWQPIETAPEVAWGERVSALVYSPRLGVRDAEIGNWKGHIFASVSTYQGNAVESWGVTHWRPLPAPPIAVVVSGSGEADRG